MLREPVALDGKISRLVKVARTITAAPENPIASQFARKALR